MPRKPIIVNYSIDQEKARIKSSVAIDRIKGCWLWIGCHSGGGYGMMKHRGRMAGNGQVYGPRLVAYTGLLGHVLSLFR